MRKDDYAKWLLDDPRVNFAISTRGRPTIFKPESPAKVKERVVDHLEEAGEGELRRRFEAGSRAVPERLLDGGATCMTPRSCKAS